jgi:site-specific DNA-adenine methylase
MKRESPLKFLGKAGVAKEVIKYIPNDIDRMVSPFLGGGIIEMMLADTGVEVLGYDGDELLANWWQQWKLYPDRIADDVLSRMLPGSALSKKLKKTTTGLFVPPEYFKDNKGRTDYPDPYTAAVNYWLMNRATMRGGDYKTGWFMQCYKVDSRNNIFKKIRKGCPEKLSIVHQDWETTLRSHPDEFMFIDPPYSGLNNEKNPDFKWAGHNGHGLPKTGKWKDTWPGHAAFYGTDGFLSKDFERLHTDLRDHLYHRSNWIMCNYDHPETHRIYADFPRKLLGAGVKKKSTGRSHELLVFPRGAKL